MVLQLPCWGIFVWWPLALILRSLGLATPPRGIPKGEPTSCRAGSPDLPASGSVNSGLPGVAIFTQWPSTPNCQLSNAMMPLQDGHGHVWQLVTLPGALVLHPGTWTLLQGLGRSWCPPPLWPPTWMHLIGHPSQWEAQDTYTVLDGTSEYSWGISWPYSTPLEGLDQSHTLSHLTTWMSPGS